MARTREAYDRFSDAVDGPLLVLAVLWLPVLVVPLVSHPSPAIADTLDGIDYLVWAVFAGEYLVKLYLAPDRRRFVWAHLLDLVVIVVPFLRPLRALRLVRLLRFGRVLIVLGEALRRGRAILTHRGLHFVVLAVVLIVAAGAALVLAFEHNARGSNIHDYGGALWWAVVTATTVGYGDRFPVTAAGRGVAVVLMLVGIGLVGVVTATVASYFVEQQSDSRLAAIDDRLARIEALLAASSPGDEGDAGLAASAGRQANGAEDAGTVVARESRVEP